jgi:molecular chaperone HscB
MNHFDLYNIPVTLRPDQDLIKKKFYELSRAFHPDFHSQASVEEQADALERSAQVNQAYKMFRDPDANIKYVLQLKGLLEEEEKYQLSPDFLMEMLDLNEQAMEVSGPEDKQQLEQQIANTKQEIYEPVAKIVAGYQEGITTEEELLQVKEYYYRKKYLDRILEGLANN